MTRVQRRQQVFGLHMRAASDVDDRRTGRQLPQQIGVDDVARVFGIRQKADQNIGARQKGAELILTGIALDTFGLARRACPACGDEAKLCMHLPTRVSTAVRGVANSVHSRRACCAIMRGISLSSIRLLIAVNSAMRCTVSSVTMRMIGTVPGSRGSARI